ncbi:MAG: chitobiase/beta-hexosaminidase C-terminal domain-containing protein, partial [Polyangiales bacterium]
GTGGTAGTGGTGGTITSAVTANPVGMAFGPADITVELTTDTGDPIYYTTDLSPVLDEEGVVQGTQYTGPITISDTTVLKFLTGTEGAYSPQQCEGYAFAETPIRREWAKSGHGALCGEPWRHWDADGAVQTSCAKCHGPQANDAPPPDVGMLEYLATGGNTRTSPLPLGLDCVNCHQTFPTIYNNLAKFGIPDGRLEPVIFPSNVEVSLYGPANICMTCHQGRESGKSVQADIDADGGAGPYRFRNVHYFAAAATFFGGETVGGYQYTGLEYRPRNVFPSHPDELSNCVGCHMTNAEGGEMHTWIPAVDTCISCHGGTSFQTLGGSPGQNYTNLQTLIPELYAAIQAYAAGTIGTPIVYNPDSYPYWFDDQGNSFTQFDATLYPAAYNYQVLQKDPNGFIHNGTYLQQLAYDSTQALGGSPSVAVPGRGDMTIEGAGIGSASKSQQWQISAHAAAGTDPFRHWDGNYEDDGYTPAGIDAGCTRCHSTPGFVNLAMGDPAAGTMPTTTVDCWGCHNNFNLFDNAETRWDDLVTNPALQDVVFPSGATASFDNASNMCMECHQGRESGVSVENATPNTTVQTPTDYDSYSFLNIHYYAAAATLFGSDVNGGYEYSGNTYRGQNTFVGLHTQDGRTLVDCIGCHMNASDTQKQRHTFLPRVQDCNLCHSGAAFRDLSGSPGDNYREIEALKDDLYTAIKGYALTGLPQASPVFYAAEFYPYWFKGIEGVDPPISANGYKDFDFNMLTAAYNYQVALKDPAGYIHNGTYVEQILWDSTCLMGGDPSTLVPGRPANCP